MSPNTIKVVSLEFGIPPFRKLGNLKINFAERLTLIAGHNGIGKSTILGLVSNTFGLTTGPRSYFGDFFYANIERIVYLAMNEVDKAKEHPEAAPVVVANLDGAPLLKRCSMTHRGEWKRARVVPRTIGKTEDETVGRDAKVPLPTIYLGLKRLASIGEADEREVDSKNIDMDPKDAKLMADFVKSVIQGSQANTQVTYQSIKGAKKKTVHPGYDHHDALAVSMGQDSLSSIATALASFNRLKRELGDNYGGGLLIIDELDVGFHPHAIDRLAKALKQHARSLDLQIVATTHSPRLIEAIHPEGQGNVQAPDSVVYLVDTRHPRLAEDQSLGAILDDMALKDTSTATTVPATPSLGVYFEDMEGVQFFESLIPGRKRGAMGRSFGIRTQLIPLGVGGSNLIGLPEKDPIFRDRILVVDADTTIPAKATERGNAIKLPCPKGAKGTDRSPENLIRNFLRAMADASEGPFYEAMLRLDIKNPSSDKIHNTFFQDGDGQTSERTGSKKWWGNHWDALTKWGVLREWAACYPDEVASFISAFEAALACTAKRLK